MTTAHLAASAWVWRRETSWSAATAIVAGAIIPDSPMFLFYAYQKLLASAPEKLIWDDLYFRDHWQLFFDGFNSIPLVLLVLAVCIPLNFRWGALFAGSALLHLICDLPLHNDDAHRHFLPLSNWRFFSPVSYWDPKYFGWFVAPIELGMAICSSVFLVAKSESKPIRSISWFVLGLYGLAIAAVLTFWLTNQGSS